jgi:hypothetical protein
MKPTLFHDIDGVLFGYYGPDYAFQLRPGVGDWLCWVHQHFDVVWLTTWKEPEIRQLLTMVWPRTSLHTTLRPPTHVHVADWKRYGSKEAWLLAKVEGKVAEWYWIDDMIPEGHLGLTRTRCLTVTSKGENTLLGTRALLEWLLLSKISSTKMSEGKRGLGLA